MKGFWVFCSVNHFSEGGVNANHNVTCSPNLAENDSRLDCSRIAKEIAMVIRFFVEGGGRRCFILSSDKNYVHPDDQTQPFEMTPGFKPFTGM